MSLRTISTARLAAWIAGILAVVCGGTAIALQRIRALRRVLA